MTALKVLEHNDLTKLTILAELLNKHFITDHNNDKRKINDPTVFFITVTEAIKIILVGIIIIKMIDRI